MKISRLLMVLVATIGTFAVPGIARADVSINQAFLATSGDNCRYGVTEGNLTWRFVAPGGAAIAVAVKGRLADRPFPNDPSICRDDNMYSVATFVLYSGTTVVDRDARRVNNGVVAVEFILGQNSAIARVDRLVIQVCRHPLATTPPSYCGRAVPYTPVP